MNSNEHSPSPTIQRALALIHNGYSAIPVGRGQSGKAPLIESWREFMPAINDGKPGRIPTETEITRWWEEHPAAKLAIPCGWHGLAVIDVDDPKLADNLSKKFIDFAPLVRTPRGGLHIYVQEEELSKNGPLIKGVVDIKSAGGYVIAPPSVGYTKINEITEPLPIPNARDYAAVLLTGLGYTVSGGASRDIAIEGRNKISEGSRNTTLTSFAGSLRRNNNDISEAALTAALLAINQQQCNPPLPDAEVMTIAKSIVKYGSPTEAWPSIIPFNEYNLPVFPVHVLPAELREWAEAEAEATQTPVDLPALLALSAVAATCQRKIEVEIKPTYTEPLSAYMVIALEPGNRKSAAFRHATKPIYDYEREVTSGLKDKIAASHNEYDIMRKRVKRAQDSAVNTDDPTEFEQKSKLASELAVTFGKMRPLVAPRYVVDDATTEKLVSLLCEHDEHIAMMSADSDIFAVMAGRYSSKGEPNFGIYLKAHIGDSHRVDRIQSGGGALDRPALTLALTVQLSVLQELSKTPQFIDRGLVARMWFSLPYSLVGRRKATTVPLPQHLTESYHRVIQNLVRIEPSFDERHSIVPHYLRFDSEAVGIFDYYAEELEPKLAPYGEYHDIVNWASKLAGSVARLTGLLHLADHYQHPAPWDIPIPPETLYRAIEIGEYLVAHARAAHGYMKTDPQVDNAKYLLGWIHKLGATSFTKRELYRRVRGKLQKVSDLEAPLFLLVQHGYLREAEELVSSGAGRKPATYEVHPDFAKKYGHNGQNTSDDSNSGHFGHKIPENPHLIEDVAAIFGDTIVQP